MLGTGSQQKTSKSGSKVGCCKGTLRGSRVLCGDDKHKEGKVAY